VIFPVLRSRSHVWLIRSEISLAIVGLSLLVLACGAREEARPRVVLAETRGIEARFTSADFDRYRPYRVHRGGGGGEVVPLAVLVELERAGDGRALAAAHAMSGEIHRARGALEALAATPERDSDRAALALITGDPRESLRWSDRALASAPGLAPARWNRAWLARQTRRSSGELAWAAP